MHTRTHVVYNINVHKYTDMYRNTYQMYDALTDSLYICEGLIYRLDLRKVQGHYTHVETLILIICNDQIIFVEQNIQ